jgi:16S rRNA (uracil1498-N3)-methyltransferase
MKRGNPVILFDGSGCECKALIKEFKIDTAIVEILEKNTIPPKNVHITLSQSLPKGYKLDFIIQKATELGVDTIIPFWSERSIPRFSQEKTMTKSSRWVKIAVEATRQCGRTDIPEIKPILSFEKMLTYASPKSTKIILWEDETKNNIKSLLRENTIKCAKDFFVVVGPEGGFTEEEIHEASAQGFISASLGKQRLKVETAVITILAIIQYEKGLIGNI